MIFKQKHVNDMKRLLMSEEDSKQIDILYRYMKQRKKALKLLVKCKVCKNSLSKHEFYTSTKVCKSCWLEYVGLTKKEKRELNETNTV